MMLGWVVLGGEVGGVGGVREKVKKQRGVGKGLGPWGAMRAAWEFLAHTDFETTPVFLATSGENIVSTRLLCR
jgi:U3 small nucleolar RNA-associated protein 22